MVKKYEKNENTKSQHINEISKEINQKELVYDKKLKNNTIKSYD